MIDVRVTDIIGFHQFGKEVKRSVIIHQNAAQVQRVIDKMFAIVAIMWPIECLKVDAYLVDGFVEIAIDVHQLGGPIRSGNVAFVR